LSLLRTVCPVHSPVWRIGCPFCHDLVRDGWPAVTLCCNDKSGLSGVAYVTASAGIVPVCDCYGGTKME
jgi:hypothetical protein